LFVAAEVYETIAEVADDAVMRVLVAALQGYGFHPLARNDQGPFGMPGYITAKGWPVEVPEREAADARVLAEALLRDMAAGTSPGGDDEPQPAEGS
jgi:hypothetical protein